MSTDAFVADAVTDSGIPQRPNPNFRSKALATVAIVVAAAPIVILCVEVYCGTAVLTWPAAWALSEFHTMLHAELFGSFSSEHPNISKITHFVGLGAMLVMSARHLRHEWVHVLRDSFAKDGAKVLMPAMKQEFGGHVVLCLMKSVKIAIKAKAHKIAGKLADLHYDGSRRHNGPSFLGIP